VATGCTVLVGDEDEKQESILMCSADGHLASSGSLCCFYVINISRSRTSFARFPGNSSYSCMVSHDAG